MKLVIDIDDDYVKIINKNDASNYPEEVIKNGIPLDKIRAEIEKTASRYTISRERGAMGQVEWSDRLIKESEDDEICNNCIHMLEMDEMCRACKNSKRKEL